MGHLRVNFKFLCPIAMAKSKNYVSCSTTSVLDIKIKISEYWLFKKTQKCFYKHTNYNYETLHVLWDIKKNHTQKSSKVSVFVQTTTGAMVSAWHSSGFF